MISQKDLKEIVKNMGIVDKASLIATVAHNGQRYGEYTYIRHLQDVISNLQDVSDDTQVVALLHDSIEDTWVTTDYLVQVGFPDNIIEAIDIISKKIGQSLNEYLDLVKTNKLALTVKRSDTMSNLKASFDDGNKSRIKKYSKQLIELYS